MISFSCGACDKQLTAQDADAGKRARCSGCREVLWVPSPTPAGTEPQPQERKETPSELPVGFERLIKREQQSWRGCAQFGLLVGVGLMLVSIPLGDDGFKLGLVVGGLVCIGGFSFGLCSWFQGRRLRRKLEALQEGDHLAHWTYPPQESPTHDQNWEAATSLGEVYITLNSLYLDGTFIEWGASGVLLKRVAWATGPQKAIELVVYYPVGEDGTENSYSVPVPVGKEREAQRVIRALEQEVDENDGMDVAEVMFSIFFVLVASFVALLAFVFHQR